MNRYNEILLDAILKAQENSRTFDAGPIIESWYRNTVPNVSKLLYIIAVLIEELHAAQTDLQQATNE